MATYKPTGSRRNARLVLAAFIAVLAVVGIAAFLALRPERANAGLLYEIETSWGPCPVDDGCHERYAFYGDGRLVFVDENGKETVRQLSSSDAERAADLIEGSALLREACGHADVTDFWSTATVRAKGDEKKVDRLVGSGPCREDLDAIESALGIRDQGARMRAGERL